MGICGLNPDKSSKTLINAPKFSPISLSDFLNSDQYSSTYSLLSSTSLPIPTKIRHLSNNYKIFLNNHTDIITSVSISPDSTFFATSSKDKSVRLWTFPSHHQSAEFLHTKEINQVIISPNNTQVVTLSENKEIAIWGLKSCVLEKVFDSFEFMIASIQMEMNDKEVYVGGGHLTGQNTCPIRVISIVSGKTLRMYEGHWAAVNQMVFTRDCKNFVTCSGGYVGAEDYSVRFWSVGEKDPLWTYSEFGKAVNAVAISNVMKLVLAGSRDCTIHILSFKLEKKNVLRGHLSSVTSLSLTDDESFLISGALDSTIKVWDLQNQFLSYEFFSSNIFSLSFLHPYIIAGCKCRIKLFNINSQREFNLSNNQYNIEFIQINPNSHFILVGSTGKSSNDKSLQIWSLYTGENKGLINKVPDYAKVEINTDGTCVVFTMPDKSTQTVLI